MTRQKKFNDFQFYYFPFKLERNTNKNLCVFKSFQYTCKIGFVSTGENRGKPCPVCKNIDFLHTHDRPGQGRGNTVVGMGGV